MILLWLEGKEITGEINLEGEYQGRWLPRPNNYQKKADEDAKVDPKNNEK